MNHFIKLGAVEVVVVNDVYAPLMDAARKTVPRDGAHPAAIDANRPQGPTGC